jgi:hypothetical protein
MTSIAPMYLTYYVLIDCCMPTCTCTHTKLSKTSFFFGQILNPKTSFFLGRREYVSFKQILLYKNKKSKLYIRDRVAVLNDMIYEYGGNITKSHGSWMVTTLYWLSSKGNQQPWRSTPPRWNQPSCMENFGHGF